MPVLEIDGKPVYTGNKSPTISRRLRRQVTARDRRLWFLCGTPHRNQIAGVWPGGPPFMTLNELVQADRLALHTYVIRSNQFKGALKTRGLPTRIRREYSLARLPRHVWVVEAVDRQLRHLGQLCVVDEAVLDATSSDHHPQQLALHVHGVMWLQQTSGSVRFPIFGHHQPYATGGVGPP